MTEDPAPYGQTPSSDFDSQYRRVFEAAGCRTQIQLAAMFEIKQSSVSDAKRRQSVPAEWLLKLLLRKGISPAWIIHGQGPRLMVPAEASESVPPEPVYVRETRPPKDCTAQELVNELVRRAIETMR